MCFTFDSQYLIEQELCKQPYHITINDEWASKQAIERVSQLRRKNALVWEKQFCLNYILQCCKSITSTNILVQY